MLNIDKFIYIGDTRADKSLCSHFRQSLFIYAKYGFDIFQYTPSIESLDQLIDII